MDNIERKNHWEQIFKNKDTTKVSWFQGRAFLNCFSQNSPSLKSIRKNTKRLPGQLKKIIGPY